MSRKNTFLAFHVALVLLLSLSHASQAAAQSPARLRLESTQSKDSDDQDQINPDRPGIADGSLVIGAKRLQVESGVQEEFRHQQQSRQHTFFIPTLLRVGISSHWEARVEGDTFTRRTDFDSTNTTDHVSGLAPFSLGFKYQIKDSGGAGDPSVGVIVRIFPAWGTGDFSTHHVTGDLRLAADWDFAPKLSLNPNAGAALYEDDHGKLFAAALFALTLNYLPTKKLNPFIDVGLQAPEDKEGKTALVVDGGVAYVVRRNIQLDASAGTRAHGDTPPRPFISLGVSFRTDALRRGK